MSGDLSTADRLELAELAAGYAAAVDERDWDGLAQLFSPDAVMVTPDPPQSLEPVVESAGRPAILATVQTLGRYARTFHHLTGSIWDADGPDALGRTTAVAHHVEDIDPPRSWAWHVVYVDRCVRSEAGWVFERRELTLAMIEARPLVRALPLAGAGDQ